MREQVQKPENVSRTIQSNSRASKQAPISDILQAYKDRIDGKPVQRQSVNEEELLQAKAAQQDHIRAVLQQYKERNIQRYTPEEDEELIQGKFDTVQREEIDEDELLQGKFESTPTSEQEPVQREEKANNTGLPDNLKAGIENLSGYSMDDVKVHYNSDKPAQLNALAYAQGTDIHVAPGQEKHLPHEAWHVVQQKQGRVQPTMQMQRVNINDNKGLEREADKMEDVIIQRKLNIKSTGKPPFEKLNYKQYKSLKSRMDVPISYWLLLRKMALSEDKTFEFANWRQAIDQAPEVGKANPIIISKTIYGMREDIVKGGINKDRNKQMLPELVDLYNQDKKEQSIKPHFKSPETKADKLLMFGDVIDEKLSKIFEIKSVSDGKKQFYPEFDSDVFIEWTEDHLNVFGDTYSTTLPIYDYQSFSKHEKDKGFKGKILEEREKRTSQTSAMSYTTDTSIVPLKPDKHIFLRSVVDGGNMLPAPNFAIIGKDSLVATSIQNGIDEEGAKELIAKEYGYEKKQLCFVEQPDYHIDLMIMLLGGNKIMVKQKNKDIELGQTIKDLQSFEQPQLNVTIDKDEIAGKQTQDGKWEYNFFNGEYIIGKDKKLYYLTNGTVNEDAESKFREYMKKEAKVEDVIFSSII